jgi:RNA polymerase-binding transcription factor DksA
VDDKDNDRLSRREVEEIRTVLIERKRKIAGTLGRLSGEAIQNNPKDLGEISSLPQHLADLGTETSEQDKDLGLAERASEEIAEIDEALERLKDGSYGICDGCEGRIAKERLEALPHASLCMACKVKEEGI